MQSERIEHMLYCQTPRTYVNVAVGQGEEEQQQQQPQAEPQPGQARAQGHANYPKRPPHRNAIAIAIASHNKINEKFIFNTFSSFALVVIGGSSSDGITFLALIACECIAPFQLNPSPAAHVQPRPRQAWLPAPFGSKNNIYE